MMPQASKRHKKNEKEKKAKLKKLTKKSSRKRPGLDIIPLAKHVSYEKLRDYIRAGFVDFPDPRDTNRVLYPIWYIIFVILSASLSGCDTVQDIALFAQSKEEWLNELMGLGLGAPSYNTIWNVLVRVDPDGFKSLLARWFEQLPGQLKQQLLSIDGKRVKGASRFGTLLHVVEIFATDSGLTLAQEKVPEGKTEVAVVSSLLESVNVDGAIITMDAFYAKKDTIKEITDAGADYIIGLKDNQPTLHQEAENFFSQVRELELSPSYQTGKIKSPVTTFSEEPKHVHGRDEQRIVRVTRNLKWLDNRKQWKDLKTLIEVEVAPSKRESKPTYRYYFSSVQAPATKFADWIRGHWAIESVPQAHKGVQYELEFCA